MTCPDDNQLNLLSMGLLDAPDAGRLESHAQSCERCGERVRAVRRQHIELMRTYEAFDRDHDEQRETLMAMLPDAPPANRSGGKARRVVQRMGDFVMHNRKIRFTTSLIAAAACVVIGVVLFGSNKTFALDGIGEALQKAGSMVCRTTVRIDAMLLDLQFEGKTYMSSEYGSRTDMYAGDTLIASTITTLDGRVISGVPGTSQSIRVNFEDTSMLEPQKFRPDAFIDRIKSLTGDADADLGIKVIDGVEAHGFEIAGSKLGLSPATAKGNALKRSVARIWADRKTLLPVKFEVELPGPLGKGRMDIVCDQFEWNSELDPSLFDTSELESAAEGTRVLNVPAATEASLIAGLKEYSDVMGEYPNSLNFVMIGMEVWRKASTMTPEEKTRFADDKDGRDFMQRLMPLYAGTLFFQQQAVAGETKYFGQRVSPGDADKVLVRWGLEDGSTRVIYGDLRAETSPAGE